MAAAHKWNSVKCAPGDTSALCANQQPQLLGVTSALLALSTMLVVLRLVSRGLSAMSYWFDDAAIVVALIISWGDAICIYVLVKATGVGRHIEAVPNHSLTQYKSNWSYEILYPFTIVSIKMSILLFYNRLFGVRNAFRYSVFALMAATWAWGIAVFFATLFQCKPIAGNWDKTIPGSHCLLDHILLKLSIPNAVLDWFVLFLPIVVVWNLQISIDRKVALSAIFLVGAFACAASILRCWAIANIDHVDSTWSYTRYMLWTQVELSVGIICACLPTLQPVLNATLGPCFGRVFATFHSTKKASAASDGSGPSSSSKWHASSSNKGSRNQMSGRGNSTVASNNGDWNRLADGTAGLAPTNNTVTSAWTVDEGDEQSDDAIPLKGIRVQQDLEQNMQRGLRPGMAL